MADDDENKRTITLSAIGQVTATPDMARIQSGVLSEAKTAREALSSNNDTLKKLLEGLKSQGIESKDIQTVSFHIEPRYTQPREGQQSMIVGYRVSNQLEISVRNLTILGELLDKLVTLGSNQMGGLTFEVSEAEQLKDTARKEAVKNAYRRAELYANATQTKLGKVLTISEGDSQTPQPLLRAVRSAAADVVPLEKGSVSIEANVTIMWELE